MKEHDHLDVNGKAVLEEALNKKLQDGMKAVLYSPEAVDDPDKYHKLFFFLEQELTNISKFYALYWVDKVEIDFEKDMATQITLTREKPKGLSYARLSSFLINFYEAIISRGMYIYRVKLQYGEQPAISVGEHPDRRQTCCDLKQYPKSKDYALQLQQATVATTFI